MHKHMYKRLPTHAPMRNRQFITVLLSNILCVNFLKSHMSTLDVTHLENSNEKQKDECLSWYSNRPGLLRHILPVKLFQISHENFT